MSALQERLGAAVELDALGFDGTAFAGQRYGAVRGRIARRRAARSAGIGGASVLGVGAVAFGAGQVPWGGLVLGSPGSSPSVVCTTTAPDAVTRPNSQSAGSYKVSWTDQASPREWTISTQDSSKTFGSLHMDGATMVVASPTAADQRIEADADGAYRFALDSLHVVWNWEEGEAFRAQFSEGDAAPDAGATDPDITVRYVVTGQATPAPGTDGGSTIFDLPESVSWLLLSDRGAEVAKVVSDGTTLSFAFDGGDVQRFPIAPGSVYHVKLPDGTTVAFSLRRDDLEYLGAVGAGASPDSAIGVASEAPAADQSSSSPSVTCEPQSPDPSASASSSAAPSATASAPPSAAGDSPFQCGYEFASDEQGSDALRVFGAATTDSAIRKVFDEWYGNQAPTTEVGDTGALAYHATLQTGSLTGVQVTAADPDSIWHDVLQNAVGMTFVAVKDGAVVGTIPTDTNNAPGLVVDGNGEGSPLEAFLWSFDGMTACGSASVDGADIYAVAGFGSDGGDVEYAWIKVSG